MNTIVIYKSQYGAAKKYAEHIAAGLGCKAFTLKEAEKMPLDAYDAIVFGGGVYVSKVAGAKFIVKNFDKLKGKKLAAFAVGLTSTENTQVFKSCIDASFPAAIQDKIRFFYFGGGMDINKLSFFHRFVIRTVNKMLEKKPPTERTDNEKDMLALFSGVAAGKPTNLFDANAAAPLIEYIKN